MQTGIFLTSKSLSYVIPCQLALSQLPGSALAALVGWAVGTAYRRDLLPYASQWRVPGWLVGEKRDDGAREGFEGLRRRLEGERGNWRRLGRPFRARVRGVRIPSVVLRN